MHNNIWLFDRFIQYLSNVENVVKALISHSSLLSEIIKNTKSLVNPFLSNKGLNSLLGMGKGYVDDQRLTKNAKKVISKSILNRMCKSIKNQIS